MAISRDERMEQMDGLLANLTSPRGVSGAAVIDGDGLVLHVRRDFEVDADALGSAVQIIFSAARRAAQQVQQGEANLVLSENADGLILLQPLAKGFVLAIVADRSAVLGALRYEVRESAPLLNKLL